MINYNSDNINHAKQMRHNMTPWEGKLWHIYLKKMPIKIYKQRLIDNYIIDFYCPKARLAIELDGSQHRFEDNKEYDIKRTEKLNSLDIKVLRISNLDIDKNLEGVVQLIDREIKQRIKDK